MPHHGIFVERRVLELRARTGWTFEVVAPVPWFPLTGARWGQYAEFARVPDCEERAGIRVHHPRFIAIPGVSWRVAHWMIYLAARKVATRLHAEGEGFDLIDAHFAFPDGVAATLIGRRLDLPVVITARGSDINDSPNYRVPRAALRAALGRAACRVAVSEPLAKGMLELTGGSSETVCVLSNGVDRNLFRPYDRAAAKERLGLEGAAVLSVGNLRTLKGHHLLIEAISGLDGVTLLIAGGGSEREPLQALASDLGVSERVRFLGVVEQTALPALYAAADVFALASSSEGCPNVVLEAMACGVPIVATPVGAIPQMVPEAGRRYLVHERTADAFRERIAAALADSPSPEVYLARAAEFSWDTVCDELARQMRLIAGRSNSVGA